jgi:hypothetical protein
VPDVVRRLVERGLPELIMAGAAGHPDVTHAAASFGPLPGGRADAGLPADLGATGPQPMAERAELGLVFENRYRHEDDHAQPAASPVLLRPDHRHRHPPGAQDGGAGSAVVSVVRERIVGVRPQNSVEEMAYVEYLVLYRVPFPLLRPDPPR